MKKIIDTTGNGLHIQHRVYRNWGDVSRAKKQIKGASNMFGYMDVAGPALYIVWNERKVSL